MSVDMELVRLLGTRFIARKDVKAFQHSTGDGWSPVKCEACKAQDLSCGHRPMTLPDFEAHLAGTRTMGHYMVNPEDQTVKLFAYDLDLVKPIPADKPRPEWYQDPVWFDAQGNAHELNPREAWVTPDHPAIPYLRKQLRCLAEGIAQRVHRILGIPVAIADSGGKGLHVYCFTGPIPAVAARDLASQILEGYGCFERTRGQNFWRHDTPDPGGYSLLDIETFPKQSEVGKESFGNLMKLPLGIHRKTGRKSVFLTTRSALDQFIEMDPVRAMSGDLPWE